jgi:hypothetical protein
MAEDISTRNAKVYLRHRCGVEKVGGRYGYCSWNGNESQSVVSNVQDLGCCEGKLGLELVNEWGVQARSRSFRCTFREPRLETRPTRDEFWNCFAVGIP